MVAVEISSAVNRGAVAMTMRGIHRGVLLVGFGLGALAGVLRAESRTLAVGAAGWELSGQVTTGEHLGRTAFALATGRAVWRDLALADGTIDLAMAFTGRRSFAYVNFRMVSETEHEEVYLRPQKSRLPDAIQYAPVFHGESGWQLYHGPAGTAAAELPPNTWIPVRIVLSGRRAAVFVGDLTTPRLVIPRLAREPAAGFLALSAFLPAGVAADADPQVWMSAVTLTPGAPDFDFSAVQDLPAAPAGSLMALDVSAPFVPSAVPLTAPPTAGFVAAGSVEADATGRFDLYRGFGRPEAGKPAAVWLRARLRATAAGTRVLRLGFSDQATVFLDGQPLAAGDARYSFDAPRQEGVMTLGQMLIFLPLTAGDHELLIGLADSFGGMGLLAQLTDGTGVEVLPRTSAGPTRSSTVGAVAAVEESGVLLAQVVAGQHQLRQRTAGVGGRQGVEAGAGGAAREGAPLAAQGAGAVGRDPLPGEAAFGLPFEPLPEIGQRLR
jgi:hypothetical protein